MIARRASSSPVPAGTGTARWLPLSVASPAVVALGFVAGWLLGEVVLRPVHPASLEKAGA